MKRASVVLIVCSAVACGGSARREPAPSPDASSNGNSGGGVVGMFDYTASMKGREVRGRFAVQGRLVIFDLPDATCHATAAPDWMAASSMARYECRSADAPAPMHFNIDVKNPFGRSTWEMTVVEQRQRSVCIEYVNRGGRNVCSRTQTQTVDVTVPMSGPLLVRRSNTTPQRQPQPTARGEGQTS